MQVTCCFDFVEIQDSVVDAGNLSEEYLSKIITVVSTLKQLDQVQLEAIRIRMGSLKVLNLLFKHVHFLSNPSACTQTIQVNTVNTYYPWNFPLRGEKTSIWCLFTSQSSQGLPTVSSQGFAISPRSSWHHPLRRPKHRPRSPHYQRDLESSGFGDGWGTDGNWMGHVDICWHWTVGEKIGFVLMLILFWLLTSVDFC